MDQTSGRKCKRDLPPWSGARHPMEVRASFGGSEFAVQELTWARPRAGLGVRHLFLLSLSLWLVTLGCFGYALANASANNESYRQHLAAQEAAHRFRPQPLPGGLDWIALGSVVGSLFCASLALVRSSRSAQSQFRVGVSPNVDLPMVLPGLDEFPLAKVLGEDLLVSLLPEWTAHIDGGPIGTSEPQTLTPLAMADSAAFYGLREVLLPRGSRLHIAAGLLSFTIQPTRAARKLGTGPIAVDSQALATLAATALVVLGLVAVLGTLHDAEERSTLIAKSQSKELLIPPMPSPVPPPPRAKNDDEREASPQGTERIKRDSATGSASTIGSQKAGNNEQRLSREEAMAVAQEAGILGIIADRPGGEFDSLRSPDTFAGVGDAGRYAAPSESLQDAAAGWGYGISEVGSGSAGGGWGTIGVGRYGNIGDGSGGGRYAAISDSGGGGHPEGWDFQCGCVPSIPVCVGPSISTLSVSTKDGGQAVIRRALRRQHRKFQHCYEKSLLITPELRGTVNARFQLSPLGRVQGAVVTGVGDESLWSCIANQIRDTEFPATNGGVYLDVHYSFKLRPPRWHGCSGNWHAR